MARDGDPVHTSVVDQTQHLLEAIGSDLEGEGRGWQDVVLVYLYLSDMAHYAAINALYGRHFTVRPPARYSVGGVSILEPSIVPLTAHY